MTALPRVVVVGGGFGGLWCVGQFKRAAVDVVLIDAQAYHTFYPLLYQVGAAELGPTSITHPIRSILRGSGVTYRRGRVVHVDPEQRELTLADGAKVEYDRLVLAMGSVSNPFGVEGVEEHAYPMRTMPEALRLRRHILDCFEAASSEPDLEVRRSLLTFVVVGGGATGVEYAGALAELVRGALHPDYPGISRREPQVVLMEAGPRLLPGMAERLGAYADERLRDRGVDIRFGAKVAKVSADGVRLVSGSEVQARSVVWTAGIRGDPVVAGWGLPMASGGRVAVEPTLQVVDHPEIYAVGDLAYVEAGDGPLPQVAQTAMQQGEHAARNVIRSLRREEQEAFKYRDLGMMAVIGRNAAVAEISGRKFTGWIAWALWLAIHLLKLIGFRNRALVMVNWAWNYLTFPRSVRLVVPQEGESPSIAGAGADATGEEAAAQGRDG